MKGRAGGGVGVSGEVGELRRCAPTFVPPCSAKAFATSDKRTLKVWPETCFDQLIGAGVFDVGELDDWTDTHQRTGELADVPGGPVDREDRGLASSLGHAVEAHTARPRSVAKVSQAHDAKEGWSTDTTSTLSSTAVETQAQGTTDDTRGTCTTTVKKKLQGNKVLADALPVNQATKGSR